MATAELDTIKAQFKAWDQDGDGTISYEELKFVMAKLSPDMSENDLDLLMKEIDDNGDGVIQFEEFVNWIANPGSSKAMDEQGNFTNFDFKATLRPLFRIFDRDGGGSISLEEFIECQSLLINSMKLHPESSSEEGWANFDFSSIDRDGSGEIDFDEFCEWQGQVMKECGVSKQAMPELINNIVEALKTILEIDEAVQRGESESKVQKALQESVEKVAKNAQALFSKKSDHTEQARSCWCNPPRGFSLQLLARKCASELGLGLGGLDEKEKSKPKGRRLSRSSTMSATGQVRLCIPAINGGRHAPASKWFARVSRCNKTGDDEFFIYVFDVNSGKLDWSRSESDAEFQAALASLPKDIKIFCLLKTRGLMGKTVAWPGVRDALMEASEMGLLRKEDLDVYGEAMIEIMLKMMEDNDEIVDIEEEGKDLVEVAIEKLDAEAMQPLQVLASLAQLNLLDVSENSIEQMMDGEEGMDDMLEGA